VLSGVTLTQIAAGSDSACGLSSTGAAYCWGGNGDGELGNSSTTGSEVPVAVTTSGVLSGVTLTQIDIGTEFACALSTAAAAYCWGNNGNGELGNSSTTGSDVAVAVTTSGALSGVYLDGITAGSVSTCALGSAGAAYCWGDGASGRLGNGSTSSQDAPVAVTTSGVLSGVTLTQITAGTAYGCVLGSTGAAYCWGLASSGQLGDNSTSQTSTAVAVYTSGVLSGVALAQINAGATHTCALDTTGAAYCWGDNTGGDLGNNSTTQSNVAVVVSGIIPGAPTGVAASPGNASASVSWTAPTSFGTGTLTSYTATATGSTGSFSCTSTSTSCTISGLTNGVSYTVTVITQTTDGPSPPSSSVNVTASGGLSLTSPGSLTWATTANGSDQTVVDTTATDQQFTAADLTGSGAGWHITVSATTFTSGSNVLPNAGAIQLTGSTTSLASTAPTATCQGTCTVPTDTTTYPVAITTAASSPTAYTVYDTAAGTGEGTMILGGSTAANPIGWWVQVPATALAGSYVSTVAITLVSGP
jgi:Fibronectin type III domain/Regulator of chromosome condensation (RCC1) repeat